jgi:O-methyltransferase
VSDAPYLIRERLLPNLFGSDVSKLPWTELLLQRLTPPTRQGIQLRYEDLPRLRELRHPRAYRRARPLWSRMFGTYTMLYPRRGRLLYELAFDTDRQGIPGALVDCGTCNGGSTALLSAGSPGRPVWAFDSFQGMPAPTAEDNYRTTAPMHIPECVGSEVLLREAVAAIGNPAMLTVCAGWFADTFPSAVARIPQIAVLHCDSDFHDSVLLTLETFYPAVAPGGYVIIDDYGAGPGARKAVSDFRRQVRDNARLIRVDQTGRYWRKP